MGQLDGKVALITGASKGIGRVMSRLFAKEGAAVVCAARSRDLVEETAALIKGDGGRASLEGDTALTGRIPVNTSGGLLAKGHPIGATGVAQITECWWQLRGEAGDRQVETRNGYALQHNAGGRGSGVAVVNILTNRTDAS